MRKFNIEDVCNYVLIFLSIVFLILVISADCLKFNIEKSKFPRLENSIEELETAMGGYSGYYVVIDTVNNPVIHNLSGSEIDENHIEIVVPENLSSDIILDFYTSWDEKLGSYRCDFDKYNEYLVNNKTISITKSSLPFVFINVDKDDLNAVNASYRGYSNEKKKAIVKVTSYVDGKYIKNCEAQLSPRGSSTWNLYNKMPYGLKLANKINMFGFGNIKSYNLLANASDKTLLKNEVFFDLCRELDMAYTPKIRNVNMFFNDSYEGIYSISTKIKVGKDMVNLNIGDFLVCWGAPRYKNRIYYTCNFWTEDTGITEDGDVHDTYVDLEWPEEDMLTPAMEKKVGTTIQDFIDIIEGRKEGKLSDYIDLESWAKYYWIREIGMDCDGWYRSVYTYYKHDTDKLYAGPMWDMEFVLGANPVKNNISFKEPEGWKIRNNAYYVPMFQNQEFVDEVNRIYYDYDIETLMYESYDNFVKKVNNLSVEGDINYRMWFDENTYHDPITVQEAHTYKEYCDMKLDFYKRRIDWIANEMK